MKTLFASTLFSLTLSIAITSDAIAKDSDAKIRYGNSPIYGKTLEMLQSNRLIGRLSDLEGSGGGEDEEFALACYEGKKNDVCGLLEIAVAEENTKGRLSGAQMLKLTRCEKNQYNSIIAIVENAIGERLRLPNFSPCNR